MTPALSAPVPPGPPFDPEVLAELHAGAFPDDVSALLRARIARDPEATAAFAAMGAALDDVAAELHRLPPIPIPHRVASRLDGVIAAEVAARAAGIGPSGPVTPVTRAAPVTGAGGGRRIPAPPDARPPAPGGPAVSSLEQARAARDTRRAAGRPQRRWAIGLGVAAAIAAVVTVGAALLHPGGTSGRGVAGTALGVTSAATSTAPPASVAPTVGTPSVGAQAVGPPPGTDQSRQAVIAEPHHLDQLLPEISGSHQAGPLADPTRLQACLRANGVGGDEVLGVLPVQYRGQQAYAISLRGSEGAVRILVVRPGCGATGADLLEEQTTGG